jgi:hypothetical protein
MNGVVDRAAVQIASGHGDLFRFEADLDAVNGRESAYLGRDRGGLAVAAADVGYGVRDRAHGASSPALVA